MSESLPPVVAAWLVARQESHPEERWAVDHNHVVRRDEDGAETYRKSGELFALHLRLSAALADADAANVERLTVEIRAHEVKRVSMFAGFTLTPEKEASLTATGAALITSSRVMNGFDVIASNDGETHKVYTGYHAVGLLLVTWLRKSPENRKLAIAALTNEAASERFMTQLNLFRGAVRAPHGTP